MDRYTELLHKERVGRLTNEESDELQEMKQEEFEDGISEAEKVGMTQTVYGWM